MGKKMQFGELDQYLFGQGTHYDIYKKLGAHLMTYYRKSGVYFAERKECVRGGGFQQLG